MDRLKKARAPLRTQLTRLINQVTPLIEEDDPDKKVLQAKYEMLGTVWRALEEADLTIKDQLLDDDADEDLIQAETDAAEEYQEKYILIKNELKSVLEPRSPAASSVDFESAVSVSGDKKKKFKLPKIELMKFNGDLRNWIDWWSQYRQIHEDEDLDNSDKFQYLSQAMEPGSEAKDIIKTYPQSPENYDKAVEALYERYGRDDLQLQFYVRELLSLVITNVVSKDKLPLAALYLKLESHLSCLSALKLDQADPATWLFPLVESSLSKETMRAWQRSSMSKLDGTTLKPPKTKLDLMMDFIKSEVRGEQSIQMAEKAFQKASLTEPSKQKKKTSIFKDNDDVATAAGLMVGQLSCAFCEGKHETDRCIKAQSMTYDEKQEKIQKHKLCFRCLTPGHSSRNCKRSVKCIMCGGKHYPIICRGDKNKTKDAPPQTVTDPHPNFSSFVQQSSGLSNQCSSDVLLNTLLVRVTGDKGSVVVRMVGDTGSQRSYIRQEIVKRVGLKRVGQEYIQNVLFGGATTQPTCNGKFATTLSSINGATQGEYQLLERPQICGALPKIPIGPWTTELNIMGIQLTDVGVGCAEVDILIGNDIWGNLLVGPPVKLQNGLVAVQTVFGWTLTGRVPSVAMNMSVAVTSSLINSSCDLSDLWNLEALGIRDPIEVQSHKEEECQALQHFKENVKRDEEGRYIVALPWKVETACLPTNKAVAARRLQKATIKLQQQQNWNVYNDVFKGWEGANMIKAMAQETNDGHFLPHRPVFKESVTTPVRPVYDASCRSGKNPSLNDCLYKGPNLLELIPSLLLRFREKKIGVTADIRKAFQMLLVREEDQPYQRFLWWEDSTCKTLQVYQHEHVVFGMVCSPFLLAATINFHLLSSNDQNFAARLIESFYVDNCVTLVRNMAEYQELKTKATAEMKTAGMELRQWASTRGKDSGAGSSLEDGGRLESTVGSLANDGEATSLPVLGLIWNREIDMLSCTIPEIDNATAATKRIILSIVARVFDPIGFLAPALVPLKALIQDMWAMQIGWDQVLPEAMQKEFCKWIKSAPSLGLVKIPRHFQFDDATSKQVHVFVDASSVAYASAIYLRTEVDGVVKLQLLLAKARLAPKKLKGKKSSSSKENCESATIPRLELMACWLGVRQAQTVREALNYGGVPFQFWSDSTTALAWIRRHDQWGTLVVGNRVTEILKTTTADQWHHVPGVCNPADLPSRGCLPSEILQSKWWEGPFWLRKDEKCWPRHNEEVDEEAVSKERRKSPVLISTTINIPEPNFSSYRKNVAVWAWVLRFVNNLKCKMGKTLAPSSTGRFLTVTEMRIAEKILLRNVQGDAFPADTTRIGGIATLRGKDGLLRIQTRLTNRRDTDEFKMPIVLPKDHPIVSLLIMDIHRFHGHAGIQFIMSKTREKYWILQSRRTIRKVLKNCSICRRHQSQPLEVVPAALPEKRVQTCEPFETTGVDLFGPLFLKDGTKVWVVLFTCAFYRSLYLDPVTSLSTEAFMGALERFIGLYGRPNTVYSDNGTNFHGAVNVFNNLDWKKIEEESNIRQIHWVFNPPTAAWWGGFWERMVRSVKDLLKRILGRSKMNYDQIRTCLAGVCATINDRPLTAVTEDGSDLIPLTPAMFLRRSACCVMPETVSSSDFQKGYLRMKAYQQQLQERFRKEYLSLLVQRGNQKSKRKVSEGDVVLVGVDNKRRFQWPLGVISKLIPGTDGEHRVAQVKTSTGVLTRPLQRLFPLEVSAEDATLMKPLKLGIQEKVLEKADTIMKKVLCTKRGRVVRVPVRYGQWPM